MIGADVLTSTYGADPSSPDNTTALQNALNAAAGKTLLFDVPGNYVTGQLNPKSNTVIEFTPGVTLTKKLNGTRVLMFENVQDVTLNARDGTVVGTDLPGTTVYSSTVQYRAAKRITINDLHVLDSSAGGGGKDGHAITVGTGNVPCEDIHINGGSAKYCKRLGGAVTGGLRTRINGVELAYNTGAPGAGFDVEANGYGVVDDTIFSNCHIHHNENAGIVQSFGTNTTIIGGSSHHNGTFGVGGGSGGIQFQDGVYRPYIDLVGVAGFDNATGVITIGGNVANLPVGMVVMFNMLSGATKPAEFVGSYKIVSRHVGSNGIVLGDAVDYKEVTSFAAGFTGVLDGDPAIATARLYVFADGQSDGLRVENVKIYNNGQDGIVFGGSGNGTATGCEVYDNNGSQIVTAYARGAVITNNDVYQTPAVSANRIGIAATVGSGTLDISGNRISNMRGKGISASRWTGGSVSGNTVTNCGAYEPSSGKAGIAVEEIKGASVVGNRVTQDAGNTTTLFGIYMPSTATGGTVTDNDCTGAGTTNVNSISVSSGTNTVSNNKRRDGTLVP